MPTEAREAPVYVQRKRAETQPKTSWCTVWEGVGVVVLSWTVSGPSFPQLPSADVTTFPGCSRFCRTNTMLNISGEPHLIQKVIFFFCLLRNTVAAIPSAWRLCLHLHLHFNIFPWTWLSQPFCRLNWFPTLICRRIHDFASSCKSLNGRRGVSAAWWWAFYDGHFTNVIH